VDFIPAKANSGKQRKRTSCKL